MTTGVDMEPNRVDEGDRPPRARRIATAVLTILACIGMVASTIGLWAGRTVLDSPTFARTVADAATDPAVADALGTYLADEAVDLVWELGELERRIPDVLLPYAGALDRGLRSEIRTTVAGLITTPRTRSLIEDGMERAHAALMKVLEGDRDLPEDAVRLNLLPVLSRALISLQDRGILPARLDIPVFERGGDPEEQIAELEERLGRSIRPDFAQLTIYEGDAVNKASAAVQTGRDALVFVRRALAALVAVTVVLIAAAIGVSTRRRRTMIQLALGFAAAIMIAAFAIGAVRDTVPRLVDPRNREAATEVASAFFGRLVTTTHVLAIVGAFVAGVVALSDPRQRDRIRSVEDGLAPVVKDHTTAVRVAMGGVALVLLTVAGFRLVTVLVVAALGGLFILWSERLRRRANEPPPQP